MRRFEGETNKDIILDSVFRYLRGRKQGFVFHVLDEDGKKRTVKFVRRGQEHVSIIDPLTNKSDLIPLDRVVVE